MGGRIYFVAVINVVSARLDGSLCKNRSIAQPTSLSIRKVELKSSSITCVSIHLSRISQLAVQG